MDPLSMEDLALIAGGMDLSGVTPSTNVIDNRAPGINSPRDLGGPGSPMGPEDAPGTGFAGA